MSLQREYDCDGEFTSVALSDGGGDIVIQPARQNGLIYTAVTMSRFCGPSVTRRFGLGELDQLIAELQRARSGCFIGEWPRPCIEEDDYCGACRGPCEWVPLPPCRPEPEPCWPEPECDEGWVCPDCVEERREHSIPCEMDACIPDGFSLWAVSVKGIETSFWLIPDSSPLGGIDDITWHYQSREPAQYVTGMVRLNPRPCMTDDECVPEPCHPRRDNDEKCEPRGEGGREHKRRFVDILRYLFDDNDECEEREDEKCEPEHPTLFDQDKCEIVETECVDFIQEETLEYELSDGRKLTVHLSQ